MTQASTPTARSAGPSLYRLVSNLPEDRRLHQPADALVIIGRQLELVTQENRLAADVALGTMRFSLFRLHQGRIAQLAPVCRHITVYGEADVAPPEMPGVEFVALPTGSPLTQEWFLVIDSPGFWGALITQVVPDRTNGNTRRYLFDGALTADHRVVSRANLLLSLAQGRPAPDIGERDIFANRASWAHIAYNLYTHSEAQRLNLASSLSELPEMLAILNARQHALEQLLRTALEALHQHCDAAGELLYRCEGDLLIPVVWSGPQPPVIGNRSGIAGQALERIEPILLPLTPFDAEQALLPEAQSVVAIPLLVHGQPWGVLVIGQHEPEPAETTTTASVIGTAALLEQILASRALEPVPTPRPAMPVAPTPTAPGGAPFPGRPSMAPPQAPPTAPPAPATFGRSPTAPGSPATPIGRPVSSFSLGAPAAAPLPGPTPSGGFGLPAWMRGAASRTTGAGAPAAHAPTSPGAPGDVQTDRSWPNMQRRLMGSLVAFDHYSAEQVWADACSLYAAEAVCTELLIPVQIAVGEGWHRGEVSVAAEHFCSRFVQGKLVGLLNTPVENANGPLAIIGCAQAELHEFGAVIIALFMRWSGFRVIYLGQAVPNSTLEETVRRLRPQLVGLSATTAEAAHYLTEAGQIIARIEPPRPLFVFGGMAFYDRPDLRARIRGQFLEGDVRQIIRQIAEQLHSGEA